MCAGASSRDRKRNRRIAPVVIAGLALACGCFVNAQSARQYEAQLIAQGAVRPITGAPIRIIGWWITHNSIGTPEVHLNLYNDSSRPIRAYKIAAQLRDDFGNPACIGGEHLRAFTSQEEYWSPGGTNTGTWVLYTCDRATHYQFAVLEVVFADGGRWTSY